MTQGSGELIYTFMYMCECMCARARVCLSARIRVCLVCPSMCVKKAWLQMIW